MAGNQCEPMVVQALRRKGCATAMPMVASMASVKSAPARPRRTPKTAMSTTPSPTATRRPRASMSQAAGSDSGTKAIMNTIENQPMVDSETP